MGRSLRRSPSPSESETTLLSDSSPTDNPWPSCRNNYPTPDYTIPTHTNTNYQSDSGITSMTVLSETDKLAKILSSMMERNEADRLRDEQRREEERVLKEEERREREDVRAKETTDMILALKESQPAIPQTVHINNVKLPKMSEGEDVEIFVELFEAALADNGITEDKWKGKLHAALDTTSKLKVRDVITDHDATYDEVKAALISCGTLTFSASSEALMSADKGKILTLPIRQAVQKTTRLLEKLTTESETIREVCQYISIAINRSFLGPEVKQYIDLKGCFDREMFCKTVEEWQTTQPTGTHWSRKSSSATEKVVPKPNDMRKSMTCFFCGKFGHYS